MPKLRLKNLPKYDLNKPFTTVRGLRYFSSGTPSEHLQLWMRPDNEAGETSILNQGSTGESAAFTLTGHEQINDISPFVRKKVGNLKKNLTFNNASQNLISNKFTNLATGSGSDISFSIHFWIKATFAGSASLIGMAPDNGGSVSISVNSGNFIFALVDGSGNVINHSFSGAAITKDGWTQIGLTYSGNSATGGMKVYVNGSPQSTSAGTSGTYSNLNDGDTTLTLNSGLIATEGTGIFEIAFYHNKVLSAEDMAALYDATVSGFDLSKVDKISQYITGSGITSLSTRAYLRDRDFATGSYPTISRRNYRDRTGAKSLNPFDDRKTIIFQEPLGTGYSTSVVLGRQLPGNLSRYLGKNKALVSAPNTNPNLELAATSTAVLPGISDSRITFTPGEEIGPYIEDKIFAYDHKNNNNPFYATGSLVENAGPGFDQPLWSKSRIEIEMPVITETGVWFSTGTVPNQSGGDIHSGLTYYNWNLNRFEAVGNLTTGSNVDYMSEDDNLIAGSYLAFTPRFDTSVARAIGSGAGAVTSVAGFPFASKFDATGSQLLPMSRYIDAPFLAEKIVYQFSSSLPATTDGINGPTVYNFFIMNQYSASFPSNIVTTLERNTPNFHETSHLPGKIKDIVLVGGMTANNSLTYFKPPNLRELNIFRSSAKFPLTGTFTMTASCNFPLANFEQSLSDPRSAIIGPIIGNEFSGRTNTGGNSRATGSAVTAAGGATSGLLSSGRSIVKSVAAPVLSGAVNSVGGVEFRMSKSNFATAPYLLMPEDNLLMGWSNQYRFAGGSTAALNEQSLMNDKLFFPVAPGKLIIYGSYVREGKEFHPGLNQLLTSDAVHESIQSSDAKTTPYCYDQFDTAYIEQLTGSYLDRALADYDPTLPGKNHGRISTKLHSVLGGMGGTTGSILRAVKCLDGSERYFDSVPTNPQAVAAANNNAFRVNLASTDGDRLSMNSSSFALYPLGRGSSAASSLVAGSDTDWPRSFPFDDRYGGMDADRVDIATVKMGKDLSNNDLAGNLKVSTNKFTVILGNDVNGNPATAPPGYIPVASGTDDASNFMITPLPEQKRVFLKGFFGFGDSTDMKLPLLNPFAETNLGFGLSNVRISDDVILRGFKYGLMSALPTYSHCYFRYDRYGQVRDMLEPRKASAVLVNQSNRAEVNKESPPQTSQQTSVVDITFVKTRKSPREGSPPARVDFTDADFDDVRKNVGGNIDGIWNNKCNLDRFSRVKRPFFDQNRIIVSGSAAEKAAKGRDSYLSDSIDTLFGKTDGNINNFGVS